MKRISNMKRRYFKRAASFLAVVCCLAGACIPAGFGVVTAAPRIVFENEEIMSPDLYVIKEIESAVAGYEIPANLQDTKFTFKLTVDGEVKGNEPYILYECQKENDGQNESGGFLELLTGLFTGKSGDEDGNPEVVSYGGKIYVQKEKRRTDAKGEFQLKAGQMAKFYIGNKKEYRVDEVVVGDDFRLDRKEGTSGTMGKSGKFALFVNQWTPAVSAETTTLQVKKTVTFPDGYQLPEDQLFLFQLESFGQMDFEPCAGQPFTAVDTKTGDPVVIAGQTDKDGNGRTDADGLFYLKSECIAVFENVPTEKIYRATEILKPEDIRRQTTVEEAKQGAEQSSEPAGALPDQEAVLAKLAENGWRATTDQEQTVTAKAPLTQIVFNNINTAFTVSKELEKREGQDDSQFRNTEFIFLLTKREGEKNSQWAGAKYYLYNTTGEPAEAGQQLHQTTEQGTFTLKPGQAAIFYGIAPGTVYSVTEEAQSGFRQSLPRDLNYYTDLSVQEDEVNSHPFINEVRDPGMLTVTKRVENIRGEAPGSGDDIFTFELMKKNADGVYEPVPDTTVYSISVGGQTATHYTKDGRFFLKNGETAEFAFSSVFTAGDYKVQEVETFSSGYRFNRVEWMIHGNASDMTEGNDDGHIDMNGEGGNHDIDMSDESGSRDVDINDESRNRISISGGRGLSQGGQLEIKPGVDMRPNILTQETNDPVEIALTEAGMDVVYYNDYTPDRTDIVLTKFNNKAAGSSADSEKLPGAEFRLYRVETDGTDSEGNPNIVEKEVEAGKVYTTDENGMISIRNLSSGVYRLKETKAPEGYMVMDTIEIEIVRNGPEATVKVNGEVIQAGAEMSDIGRDNPNRKPCTATFVSNMTQPDSTENDLLTIWAYDDYLYELPSSGGIGIYWYLIGGVLLMMAAALILYRDKLRYAGRS